MSRQTASMKQHKCCASLFECLELVLPWFTPQELAATCLTCKTLRQAVISITQRRALDASRTRETHPIPFHNSVDQHPYSYFIYSTTSSTSSSSQQRQSWGGSICLSSQNPATIETLRVVDESGASSARGCECEMTCEGDGCPCVECGPGCFRCGSDCRNRSTQRGIQFKMKIVRDARKGWCLFADQFIPKGHFVSEYAGELLTTKESRSRQQMYDELSLGGHFRHSLLVVREHLPSNKACLRFNIDATRIGNVSRFINHSCDGGNLSTALVRSSGALLPRLCFFASKDIKEDEELTFSYGETRLTSKGLRCFCGSTCCFGMLPSEPT